MHRFDEPTIPELPDLDPGVTLLVSEDPITPLHSLVVDHLLNVPAQAQASLDSHSDIYNGIE